MSGKFTTRQPYRRLFELEGARVVDVQPHPNEGGCWVFELEHKGCDDDACTLLVRQADIRFSYAGDNDGTTADSVGLPNPESRA